MNLPQRGEKRWERQAVEGKGQAQVLPMTSPLVLLLALDRGLQVTGGVSSSEKRFSELESSNDARMLKLSVSSNPSRVLSATGMEWSVELSLHYRHRQITSFPDRTAALYWSLVIPVSLHRCYHLSQPSHKCLLARRYLFGTEDAIKPVHF